MVKLPNHKAFWARFTMKSQSRSRRKIFRNTGVENINWVARKRSKTKIHLKSQLFPRDLRERLLFLVIHTHYINVDPPVVTEKTSETLAQPTTFANKQLSNAANSNLQDSVKSLTVITINQPFSKLFMDNINTLLNWFNQLPK